MIHLNSFDILVDAQHGFRPGRSCETQLINTVEHLARSVNDRNQTDLLILDFSKAFDKVAHKRLLLKLEYYGIRGLVLAWIKAWLIGRTQQLALEGEFSEKSCVRSGVPQGTVLGPLCFLLFVNDIGNDITSNMYKCVTNQAAIDIPYYGHHQSSLKTRASHPLKFTPLSHPVTRTNTASGGELSLTGIACHLII